MKILTEELTGNALDWAVGVASGLYIRIVLNSVVVVTEHGVGATTVTYYKPSTDWATGGEIIGRELIDICHHFVTRQVTTMIWLPQKFIMTGDAKDVLVLAMRCYVASKLGYEVDVPDELLS